MKLGDYLPSAVTDKLEQLDRRVQDLEGADKIINLKATYSAACDDNYDADKIAALFTEDAV